MRIDLTTGAEKDHLVRMTIPMIWGLLAIMTMNLVDTFFVGQLGKNQLAAMSFTFPIVSIISSLAFGIGTGLSAVVAITIGQKNIREVKKLTSHGLLLALTLAISFALLGMISVDQVFGLLGAKGVILDYVHHYMDIWYLGCFLIVVPMAGNAATRAAGNAILPTIIMMIVAISNIILDPILIFGLGPVPALGVKGAALATIMAYSFAFIASIYILTNKMQMLSLSCFKLNIIDSWRRILHVGLPASFTYLITPISIAITTWFVARFGNEVVAGYGIASRIESISILILYSLSTALGPFVGQNWGAGHLERVRKSIRLSFKFSFIYGIITALALWLFSDFLVTPFNDDNTVQLSAKIYLHIIPFSYAFLGIVILASRVSNNLGRPIPSLIMSFCRLLAIYIPLALMLEEFFGATGIYLAIACSNIIVGIGALTWIFNQCFYKLDKSGKEPQTAPGPSVSRSAPGQNSIVPVEARHSP